MKFLTDGDGFSVSAAHITAVRIKTNRNDGSFKNRREYPFVADVYVSGRGKPFSIYLTAGRASELSLFVKEDNGGGA
jgi:hypothetical protein